MNKRTIILAVCAVLLFAAAIISIWIEKQELQKIINETDPDYEPPVKKETIKADPIVNVDEAIHSDNETE